MIQSMTKVLYQDQWSLLSLRNTCMPALRQKRQFIARHKHLQRQQQTNEPLRVHMESYVFGERYNLKIIESDQIYVRPSDVCHKLQAFFGKFVTFSFILFSRRLLIRLEESRGISAYVNFRIGVSSQKFYKKSFSE